MNCCARQCFLNIKCKPCLEAVYVCMLKAFYLSCNVNQASITSCMKCRAYMMYAKCIMCNFLRRVCVNRMFTSCIVVRIIQI